MPAWALVAIAVAGGLLAGVAWAFNRLVRLRNRVREAWAGIDVQLKLRHDLVPALVETVKGYARHERQTLEAVTAARGSAGAGDVAGRAAAENRLSDGIVALFALSEAYPELRADGNFRRLHADLVTIEDGLQYARRYYDGAVRDYDNAVQTFPSLLVARAVGFHAADYFQVESAAERVAAIVDLGDGRERA